MRSITTVAATFAAAAALATGVAVSTATSSEAGVSVPEVFAGYRDLQTFSNTIVSQGGIMALPIGTYAISGKVTVRKNSIAGGGQVTCTLTAFTGDFDQAVVNTAEGAETVALQHVAIVNRPTVAALRCANASPAQSTRMAFAKITAVRVADPTHLHNKPLG